MIEVEIGLLGKVCSPAIRCDGVAPDIKKVATWIGEQLIRDGRIRYVDGRICILAGPGEIGRYRVARDDDTRPLCRDLIRNAVDRIRRAGNVEGGMWYSGTNAAGDAVERENTEFVGRLELWSRLETRIVNEFWVAISDAVAEMDADCRVSEGIPFLNGVYEIGGGTFRPYDKHDTFLTWLPIAWHGTRGLPRDSFVSRLYDVVFESQKEAVLCILSEAMQLKSKEVALMILGAPGVGKSSLVMMLRWIFGMKGFAGGERGSAISDMGMLFKGKDVHPTNAGAFDEASCMFIDDLGDKFYFRDSMTRYVSTGGQRLPYRQMGKDFGRRASIPVQATLILQSNTHGGLTGSAETGKEGAIPDDRRVFVAYADHPGEKMMKQLHEFNDRLWEGDPRCEADVDGFIGELLQRARLEPYRPSEEDRARAVEVIATLTDEETLPVSTGVTGALVRTGNKDDIVLLSAARVGAGRRGNTSGGALLYVKAHGLPGDIVKAAVSGELRKRCSHMYQTLFVGWRCDVPGSMLSETERDEWRVR